MNERVRLRPNEAERLAALASYDILDSPREKDFDDVAALASEICGTPIAVVNLIGEGRQFFKAEVGLGIRETPLESSFCAKAILEEDFLVVPDATKDPRFDCNPLVTGEPGLRFYAGALLKTDQGHAIGTVCVLDFKPRGLTPLQEKALRVLARQVMNQLELRRTLDRQSALLEEQLRADIRRNALLEIVERLRDVRSIEELTRFSSEVIGRTLGASRAGFGLLDIPNRAVDIQPDWTARGMTSVAGRHRFDDYGNILEDLLSGNPLVIDDVRTDPRTANDPRPMLDIGIAALVNMPVRERGRTVAVCLVHSDKPRAWAPEDLAWIRNVADRMEVGVARLKAEADQRVLNHELSHRMKNTFAMVQAIAVQTLRAVPDQQPVEAFIQRIHALAGAHDVLLQQHWGSAKIAAVAQAVLGTFGQAERFKLSGPSVSLGPRSTLSISLVLHELATNALKYGALSRQGGEVRIAWQIDGPDEEPELVFTWRETGGPPAIPPKKRGFGSRLIGMGLVGSGGVKLHYREDGFEAELRAPLSQVERS